MATPTYEETINQARLILSDVILQKSRERK
jgi:hypothetical protein